MEDTKTITLNRVNKPQFRLEKIDEDYDLIKMICDEKWPPRTLLNKLADELAINSVIWTKENEQNCVYLLADKGKISIYTLKSQSIKIDKYVEQVIKMTAEEVDESVLMNLFWNKLCAFEAVRGSHLLGKLYITYRQSAALGKKSMQKYSLLETHFSRDLGLHISEKSFIPIGSFYSRVDNARDNQDKKYAQERLDKIKKRQLYEFKPADNTIKQVAVNALDKSPKMDWFVFAPLYANKKAVNAKFIKLSGHPDLALKTFKESKSGLLYSLMNIFNYEFADYLKENVTFQTREVNYYQDRARDSRSKDLDAEITDFFADKTIRLSNHAAKNKQISKKEFAAQIKKIILKYYPKTEIVQRGESDLNINLINQPSYYASKSKDKHIESSDTQNITVENWLSTNEKGRISLLKNSLKELMVKKAVETSSIKELFNVENNDELEFYKYYSETDTVLKYSSNGNAFQIEDIASEDSPFMEFGLFREDDESKISRTDYECLIRDKDNDSLMGIRKTGMYTLPNSALYKDLNNLDDYQEQNIGYRNKEAVVKYLSGLVDLNYWVDNQRYYYNVGTSSKGMHTSVTRASVIREIEMINDIPEDMDKIRSLIISMDTFWVKFKELSVLPFPIKLMNEYYLENNAK